MASGKTHDRSILLTTPIIFGLLQHYTNLPLVELAKMSVLYVFSGLYLSPDIDMKRSNVSSRYGLLKVLWYPYQKTFPHKGKFINRNFWTHAPVLGTVIRIAYFLIPCLFALQAAKIQLNSTHIHWIISLLVMTEIASLVHLFLDFIHTKRN